jgi:hypothetical protein
MIHYHNQIRFFDIAALLDRLLADPGKRYNGRAASFSPEYGEVLRIQACKKAAAAQYAATNFDALAAASVEPNFDHGIDSVTGSSARAMPRPDFVNRQSKAFSDSPRHVMRSYARDDPRMFSTLQKTVPEPAILQRLYWHSDCGIEV